MNEREAVARLQAGDIGGLETLVHLYQVRALRASYLVCGDRALAEDVVQAAFLRAYERMHQFDARRPFGPWFLRIVVNDTLMALRRRPVSLDDTLRDDPDGLERALLTRPDPGVEQMLEAAETRAALRTALEQLAPNERAVIVLRYYLNLSDNEISTRLRCAPGTVRWHLHNARKRLRDLLPSWVARPVEDC